MAGEFGESGAQAPLPVAVTGQKPVHFQPDGESVCRRPRQVGAFAEIRKAARGLGHGMQYPHRFVQHADAAILSHKEILASQIVR